MLKSKPIIAANWKMHKTRSEVEDFFNVFRLEDEEKQIWIAPSAALMHLAAERTAERVTGSPIWIGAQNIYFEPQGAFTGETSAAQAADAGARFVIIGHSERRCLFGETSAQIALKIEQALNHRLTPLLCVGESHEERQEGKTAAILKTQLTQALQKISLFEGVIAYEPVWAIGTGQSATAEVIEEAHAICRAVLTQMWGHAAAERIPVLYGGSVTHENAALKFKFPQVEKLPYEKGIACSEAEEREYNAIRKELKES